MIGVHKDPKGDMTMPGILKKPFIRRQTEAVVETDRYIDLGELVFEEESMAEGDISWVKVAEIYRYEDLPKLTNEVYEGNVIIIDYSAISNDQMTLKKVIEELKMVAKDTGGDVAGVGKNLLMIVPFGMRILREKIKGGL
ncbi:MAG: cell division protein SepF [Thermoplasmata archaeon]|nr:cell division protein SepF [Thermoplasmata archaeon]